MSNKLCHGSPCKICSQNHHDGVRLTPFGVLICNVQKGTLHKGAGLAPLPYIRALD